MSDLEPAYVAEIRAVLDPGEDLVSVCEFSPGPSWGFNGIKTLVLTDRSLRAYQLGLAMTARRQWSQTAMTSTPLAAIRSVAVKRRPGLLGFGRAVTLHLATDHGPKIFTTKYEAEGMRFAERLRGRVGA